jgi:type VI secretion system protein ImpC
MQFPRFPFTIVALAPFGGLESPVWQQAPLPVTRLELDQAFATLKPVCHVPISRSVAPDGMLEIDIHQLKDFHPDRLVQQQPVLQELTQARDFLKDAIRRNLSTDAIREQLSRWQQLPPLDLETLTAQTSPATSGGSIDNILDMVALPGEATSSPTMRRNPVQQLDASLQEALQAVFTNPDFRAMESAWRGLYRLLPASGETAVKVEMVPVGFDTLEETLGQLLSDLIDAPPALILVDLPFDNTPHRMGLLESVAGLAETLMVPTLCWISAAFFQLEEWSALTQLPFLPNYLDDAAFAKWRGLQNSSKGHWLAVTCNRFLSRYPYGRDNQPRQVKFDENQIPWINPVWGVGTLITRSVIATGWPTQFTDPQQHLLEDLPLTGAVASDPRPTEMRLDRERADQLVRCGIMPIMDRPKRDWAMIPRGVTISGLSLPYQLLVSRITHLVLWCRDHLPRDLVGEDLAAHLRQAFERFWDLSGQPHPTDLAIDVDASASAEGALVSIRWMPSRDILSTSQPIELTLNW